MIASTVMGVVLLSLSVFCGTAAGAEADRPRITYHVVNGFRVALFDTRAGSHFAFSYGVPVGHNYAPVEDAGIEHRHEHQMLKGSARHPGYHTMNNRTMQLGGMKNAYTSSSITNYFIVVPESQAEPAIDLLAAPLEGLEWNPVTIANENVVVLNEIGNEYNPRPISALKNMINTQLLPAGHPQKMVAWGNRETLTGFTLESFQRLYFETYTEANVFVVVAANFSAGRITQEQVLGYLSQYLHGNSAHREAVGWKPTGEDRARRPQPPVLPEVAENVLYVGGPENSIHALIQFDFDSPVTGETYLGLDLLSEYLTLSTPGSLRDILVHKLGWALDLEMEHVVLPNRQLLRWYFHLTPDGYAARDQVLDVFYQSLAQIQREGISEEWREALTAKMKTTRERAAKDPANVIRLLQHSVRIDHPDVRNYDWAAAFRSVTNETLKGLARQAFNPERALYGFFSKAVQADHVDPDFGRGFRVTAHPEWTYRWKAIHQGFAPQNRWLNPEIRQAPISETEPTAEVVTAPVRTLPLGGVGVRVALESIADTEQGAISARLRLAEGTALERAVVKATVGAFKERYQSELYLFRTQGVIVGFSGGGDTLEMSAEGPANLALAAVQWVAESLARFVPTASELEGARKRILFGRLVDDDNQFTIRLVSRDMGQFLNEGPLLEEVEAALAEQKWDPVRWAERIARADIQLVLVGHFSEGDATNLLTAVKKISPHRLTEDDRIRSRTSHVAWSHPLTFWKPLPEGRPRNTFAALRAFPGPSFQDLRQMAAAMVLAQVLNTETLNLNRSEQKLGYIHGFQDVDIRDQGLFFLFLGQTDTDVENLKKTMQGWHVLRSRIENRALVADGFGPARASLLRQMRQTPGPLASRVGRYELALDRFGDTSIRDQLMTALESLTDEEIYEVGRRFLGLDRPHFDTVMSAEPPAICEGLLDAPEAVRARLRR